MSDSLSAVPADLPAAAAPASAASLRVGVAPEPLQPAPHPDIEAILISSSALARRVSELGAAITADFAARPASSAPPLVLGVLKGALYFLSDLTRAIALPLHVDCLRAASYGAKTISSGSVQIVQPPTAPLEGRDVLVVDMVLDTGLTLRVLEDWLLEQGARSVRYCVLVSKNRGPAPPFPAQYVGFAIPDVWVVGYGGDYDDRYRNLPYVGILRREVYEKFA